eukprot:TRINITY_DN76949_c0_g1_i1.p1 TRINITY_DN76949_c0_g1~~TRINITY_DN76949_c0_g1_i1.p1  ORF type:complete len:677 (+),score=185.16 TRINITY_DN76949_c0_g1_i1:36-2033(+)
MHGRVKKDVVEPTPEEKEKQREQVRTARALFGKLLELRKSRTYNGQALDMTSKALQFHPEFPTLWGYRREILTSGQVEGELKDLLAVEMKLLEKALRKSQKVYSIWFHRRWVVEKLFEACSASGSGADARKVLDTELELCGRLLEVDERNFHCWNHRALVVGLMRRWEGGAAEGAGPDQSGKDEAREKTPDLAAIDLELSTDLINKNFSNYSAWHLRTLLQQAPPPGCEALEVLQPLDVDIKKELEWVQQGIYTEPNDQSVWLYHHWLTTLDRGGETPRITHCALMDGELFLFFSRPVCAAAESAAESFEAVVRTCRQSGSSQTATGHFKAIGAGTSGALCRTRQLPCKRRRWAFGWQLVPSGEVALDSSVTEVEVEVSVELLGSRADGGGAAVGWHRLCFKGAPVQAESATSSHTALAAALGCKPSSERQALLKGESEMIEELLEIEPDCKWALLARGRLTIALAAGCSTSEVAAAEQALAEGYDRLRALDPLRQGFYAEAKSAAMLRLRVLAWLGCDAGFSACLDAARLGLRHLAPAVVACTFGLRVLNVEGNELQDFGPILQLLSLEELLAAKNQLQGDVAEAFVLPKLRRLDISWNRLQLKGLDVAPPNDLAEVDLSGLQAAASVGEGEALLDRLLVKAPPAYRSGWTVSSEAGMCVCRRL